MKPKYWIIAAIILIGLILILSARVVLLFHVPLWLVIGVIVLFYFLGRRSTRKK